MKQSNAHNKNKGFTLIEMVVTIIIVGILSAVAVPSLLGLLNQTRVNDGRRQIESAIKEAQRQAVRRSVPCTVILNATNNTITAIPGTPTNPLPPGNTVQCLAGNKIINSDLEFKADVGGGASATNIEIIFSRKGINTSGPRTIAVYRDGVVGGVQKCIIITANLGGAKSGIYTGDVSNNIVSNSCDLSNS